MRMRRWRKCLSTLVADSFLVVGSLILFVGKMIVLFMLRTSSTPQSLNFGEAVHMFCN
jgi:hypothetical protein